MDETIDGVRSAPEGTGLRAHGGIARARGAARANLATALGQVWATYGAPGSVLLTLFLKEWLHAEKWQIGLVMTMTFLGPTFELPGAYLVERFGRRRQLFLITYLLNRLAFFALAAIPLLGSPNDCRDLGIAIVMVVVGGSRIVSHLGTPAWWSWIADLVPERRRGRFFGCRQQAASAVTALSFVIGMALLQSFGGMANRGLVSALFALGALFGTLDILMYLGVPEPDHRPGTRARGIGGFVRAFGAPYQNSQFRRLLLGMGLWSFSSNLVLPFLPVYQRGESLSGHHVGLGLSWLFLAALTVSGSVAAMLTSRRWAAWIETIGPRGTLFLGSGYLFVNLAYAIVRPDRHLGWLIPAAFIGGALNAAWTMSTQQVLLRLAPRLNRSFYVSAYNFTNGWLMAGGPLVGGLLADRWPVIPWRLPTGLPCTYFHVLLGCAMIGGLVALAILSRLPQADRAESPAVAVQVLWARLRLSVPTLIAIGASRREAITESSDRSTAR